jgi:acetyl esterase/lipase
MAKLTIDDIVARLRSRPQEAPDPTFGRERANLERESSKAPVRPGTLVTPVDAAGVPAEWVVAVDDGATGDGPAMLYLHGGGYTMGSCNTHRALASNLSAAISGPVLLIDYRLAPEHPFPAAVDDARAAWHFLLAQPDVSPARAVIAGDSAGGGLTAATLLALKDASEPLPAGIVCLSPFVDMEATGASYRTVAAEDPMITKDMVQRLRSAYVGEGDPRNPLASPVHGDWTGAPPMLIQVGRAEVLLDDSRTLARVAREAGVEVDLQEWDRMVHVFQMFSGLIDEADNAIARVGEFVKGVTK